MHIEGHNMFKVVERLKLLKYPLKKLAWKNGRLKDRVDKCREDLKCAQNFMEMNPHDDIIKQEEAKCLTKYLEVVIKSRANVNKILSICNEDGEIFEGEAVAYQFINHFKNFLRAKNDVQELNVNNLFLNRINNDEAELMIKDITDKEIKEAMFDIGENKAPGPDGFALTFFKNS
ncbi:hypothetical protein Tco_1487830 [Tanacetum coccineum]